MKESLHVFSYDGKWKVKKTSNNNAISKAIFAHRKEAIAFAKNYMPPKKWRIFVHNENGMIDHIE